jgi:hypothetical protein
MPKRETRDWLSRAAWGLANGVLAFSLLTASGGGATTTGARLALAEDIDCYNDKDLYTLPECVERRALDKKNGMSQNESQGASGQPVEQSGGGQQQQASGGGSPPAGGGQPQQASGSGAPPAGGGQQQASGGGAPPAATGGQPQQAPPRPSPPAATAGNDEDDEDKPEPPRGPLTDPKQAVLKIEDAGKEATQYLNEEGTDKYGPHARTRFERDRSNGASDLGPNVIDSKVWVAKDAESAKALFKEQAAIKNFPERKESAEGSVEKIKPPSYGEEFSFTSAFFQNPDNKIFQHYRFVMRVGNVVSVLYLFGKEEFFQDQKDRTWTGQGDWFLLTLFNRM